MCVIRCVVLYFISLTFSCALVLNSFIFRFAFCIRVLYIRVVRTLCCIRVCCKCCIIVLYKRVVCVLYFPKEKNQLITGERKLEEKCESAHKNILKLTALQAALLLANGSLNNYLTIIMQNIDFTHETKAQLIADKKELEKIYSKQLNRNKIILTQNVLGIYKIESKGAK